MSESLSEHARGRAMVFGATVFWGASATLARFMFRDRDIPPLTVVELRLLISASILGSWMAWRKPSSLIVEPKDWGSLLLLGILGVAAIQGGYYHSISVLGVGMAILIQYLAPSIIVLWEVMRGARLNGRVATTLAAATLGTALLVGNNVQSSGRAHPIDWVISFSTAFTFAFYIVYSKRILSRYGPETILFYTFLIAGVAWAVVTPPWTILRAGYDVSIWRIFLILAVTSALIPFALFYAGLRRMPAAEAGILATLEPVVAVVAAWLALGEGLGPIQWIGALLVLIAAGIASYGVGLTRRSRIAV